MVALGISLGTTTAGIAILDYNELIDWRTHSFRAIWSEEKAQKILRRLSHKIVLYSVTTVIIKLPPATHQSHSIQSLFIELTTICKHHGCHVEVVTRRDLKRLFPQIRNNEKLMDFVVERYPNVTREYERAKRRKNNYHKKLFEAVLAAHTVANKGG